MVSVMIQAILGVALGYDQEGLSRSLPVNSRAELQLSKRT